MAKYYPRWIGSFQKDTGHLSCTELGVYDRLLDHYYATEMPLPSDIDACARIARAMSKDERKAVSTVLREFFVLSDAGYTQSRADAEIKKLQELRAKNAANGRSGGRPRNNPDGSGNKPSRFPKDNPDITQKKPSGFSVGLPAHNPDITQNESHTETETDIKPYSVESERVTGNSSSEPPEKITHSLTPVDVFPMNHDWCPSVEFEKNLPPSLIADIQTTLRDLQEFRLYRIGTGQKFTQAQWENLWLKNLESNKKYREVNLA